MAFIWTKEKVEFFKDASRYTGFHRQIGEIIKPYLDRSRSLCDIGCGLGLIDFEIAPYVSEITAIDSSEIAIEDYKKRLSKSHVDNINIELMDFNELTERSWDIILLSLFGKPGEELAGIFRMSKKEVILITYAEPLPQKQGKSEKDGYRPTTADYEKFIKEHGYEYELILKKMDFGQPFRNLDSAKAYYESYSRESDPIVRERLIQEKLEAVRPTGDSEFPYFMSQKKEIGIIIVRV